MPAGRPTDYRPEFCELVIRKMTQGASIEELPLYLHVVKNTIYEWMQSHPEFGDAIKIGREYSKSWWLRKGRKNLKTKEFRDALWYMNMKNRFGWKDKQEHSGSVNLTQHEKDSKDLEKDCYNDF